MKEWNGANCMISPTIQTQPVGKVLNPGQQLRCDPYKNLELVWERS